MKYSDIKELPTAELVTRYKEEKNRYLRLKFNNAVSQLENPHTLRESKKLIAKFLTEINARRIENETNASLTNTDK
jgi:large subunit ribosomal protein L29